MIKFNFIPKVLLFLITSVAGAYADQILPEVATSVVASNRDVNRLVCNGGDISSVQFSKEKGVLVQTEGRNSFIKFTALKIGETLIRSTQKSEFYVTCAGNVYALVMEPKDIDAQTHYLGAGTMNNAKQNVESYGALPDEMRALELTQAVLKNEIPESFTVRKPYQFTRDYRTNVIPNAQVAKVQEVEMDGIGLTLHEYQVIASTPIVLEETQFLDVFFGANIFAVSIEPRDLGTGQYARIFVVQKGGNN